MRKLAVYFCFVAFLAIVGVLFTPPAQAIVMIKNYSRYNAGYTDAAAYNSRRGNDISGQKFENESGSFWKNLLNLFR